MSTVSLIIPVRDRLPLLMRTLASVEAQTRLPDRLIIVDNASSPETAATLAKEADRLGRRMPVSLISCPVPGAPQARNAALELVNTEWTMFFDSDDIMLPDHIASAMATADAHPEADIIGWDTVLVDSRDKEIRFKKFPTGGYLFNAIMHGSLATQSFMARTELFRKAGGWNPEATIWNDMELSVRLLLLNPHDVEKESTASESIRIVKAHTPHPTVRILTHSDSITGSDFSSKADQRDHTINLLVPLCEKEPRLKAILALKRTILAGCCRREGNKVLAEMLYRKATRMPVTRLQRLGLWFAYRYTALALPGAARLLRPLFA